MLSLLQQRVKKTNLKVTKDSTEVIQQEGTVGT